jgi:hypothetical protein
LISSCCIAASNNSSGVRGIDVTCLVPVKKAKPAGSKPLIWNIFGVLANASNFGVLLEIL